MQKARVMSSWRLPPNFRGRPGHMSWAKYLGTCMSENARAVESEVEATVETKGRWRCQVYASESCVN